jgi:hypothetical protein
MKDAEFIVDGYLSKDYFAKVAADLGWRLRPGESPDEVWVDDENGKTLGTIYLNNVGPDGSVKWPIRWRTASISSATRTASRRSFSPASAWTTLRCIPGSKAKGAFTLMFPN